jgi:hypothetical protein
MSYLNALLKRQEGARIGDKQTDIGKSELSPEKIKEYQAMFDSFSPGQKAKLQELAKKQSAPTAEAKTNNLRNENQAKLASQQATKDRTVQNKRTDDNMKMQTKLKQRLAQAEIRNRAAQAKADAATQKEKSKINIPLNEYFMELEKAKLDNYDRRYDDGISIDAPDSSLYPLQNKDFLDNRIRADKLSQMKAQDKLNTALEKAILKYGEREGIQYLIENGVPEKAVEELLGEGLEDILGG